MLAAAYPRRRQANYMAAMPRKHHYMIRLHAKITVSNSLFVQQFLLAAVVFVLDLIPLSATCGVTKLVTAVQRYKLRHLLP